MNIYSQEEVSSTDNISDISNYYEQFSRFIKIVIQLENCFSNFRMKESLHLEELPHNDMDDELSQQGKISDVINEFRVVKNIENGTIQIR